MSNLFKWIYVQGNHYKNFNKLFYRYRQDYSELIQNAKKLEQIFLKEKNNKVEESLYQILLYSYTNQNYGFVIVLIKQIHQRNRIENSEIVVHKHIEVQPTDFNKSAKSIQ